MGVCYHPHIRITFHSLNAPHPICHPKFYFWLQRNILAEMHCGVKTHKGAVFMCFELRPVLGKINSWVLSSIQKEHISLIKWATPILSTQMYPRLRRNILAEMHCGVTNHKGAVFMCFELQPVPGKINGCVLSSSHKDYISLIKCATPNLSPQILFLVATEHFSRNALWGQNPQGRGLHVLRTATCPR